MSILKKIIAGSLTVLALVNIGNAKEEIKFKGNIIYSTFKAMPANTYQENSIVHKNCEISFSHNEKSKIVFLKGNAQEQEKSLINIDLLKKLDINNTHYVTSKNILFKNTYSINAKCEDNVILNFDIGGIHITKGDVFSKQVQHLNFLDTKLSLAERFEKEQGKTQAGLFFIVLNDGQQKEIKESKNLLFTENSDSFYEVNS